MATKNKSEMEIELPSPKRKNGVAVVRPDKGLLNVWGNFWGRMKTPGRGRRRWCSILSRIRSRARSSSIPSIRRGNRTTRPTPTQPTSPTSQNRATPEYSKITIEEARPGRHSQKGPAPGAVSPGGCCYRWRCFGYF